MIIFVWREYDKNKRSFDVEKGYEDVGGVGGGGKFCVCTRGLSKIGEVKEDVKSDLFHPKEGTVG